MPKSFFRITLFISLLGGAQAGAQGIKIDPDAIATESVYPKFLKTEAVKSRNVDIRNSVQAALFFGVTRNNAFFDSLNAAGSLSYYFSHGHGVEFAGIFTNSQPSTHSEALDANTNVKNLDLAPAPQHILIASYKLVPFYGKISLTKKKAYNFNAFTTLGPGLFNMGGKYFPAVNIGIGQNLYLGDSFGFLIDIRGLLFNGPDPLSVNLNNATTPPDPELFSTTFSFNLLMHFGIIFRF